MAVMLATKTMVAIDAAMRADQGASFRQWEEKIFPHLDDAYRGADHPWRHHLGASLMGEECGRAIWYDFRWVTRPDFSGQALRLFNRGHLEEGRFMAVLLTIGAQVFQQDENGKQFRIKGHDGHYGGSGDGFVLGIPDLPATMYAGVEGKTHGEKYFHELAGSDFRKWFEGVCGRGPKVPFSGKGVRVAKWDHYVQMQQYMRKFNIVVCLYMAVNKNTDDLYLELVELDSTIADQFIDRAGKIIWLHDTPSKMPNASPAWFKCKFCDHSPVCHLGKPPARNCRTCGFSEPRPGGDAVWWCRKHERPIGKDEQVTGCGEYIVKKL